MSLVWRLLAITLSFQPSIQNFPAPSLPPHPPISSSPHPSIPSPPPPTPLPSHKPNAPRTYLARLRLSKALSQIRSTNPPVTFTLHYQPYQLYPSFPTSPKPKYEWYKREKYNDSEEQMAKYMALMSAYGVAEGIRFSFGGSVSNTFHAHRILQFLQMKYGNESGDGGSGSGGVTEKFVKALYRMYFEEEADPGADETLVAAAMEAGVGEKEARELVADKEMGAEEVKEALREQRGNGVDAVPYVVVEGRRRDFTLEGCREVGEYVKVLEGVVRECS